MWRRNNDYGTCSGVHHRQPSRHQRSLRGSALPLVPRSSKAGTWQSQARSCGEALSIARQLRQHGAHVAWKLLLKCDPFQINILVEHAMMPPGNGQATMNDMFAVTGLCTRAMHKQTFQQHLKDKQKPAAIRAAKGIIKECLNKRFLLPNI